MSEIKLAKLPDRTPIKLTLTVLPELHVRLEAYSRAYEVAYGKAEPIAELIPAMLSAFLDGDRDFSRRQK
jgi:hypothetical protein